ncbi:hypothetical protein [Pedobacter sp.]|jgi:hypothetical protein|uniref:hypothetical protein n=1 Tax=Pedobacter sp. TaxID=1411316 RepID=UPI002B8CA501|nr:hypothetical protein [Pedobacter sp.]HWW38589.1 hypothetical protein [Pedobacter sp.]
MQRRDIFNILFKGSPPSELNTAESEPVIKAPVYLINEGTIPFFQVWKSISEDVEASLLPRLTNHEFALKLGAGSLETPEGLSGVSLRLGIKDAGMPALNEITLGVNAAGYLFIGDLQSKSKIHYDKLIADLQFILEVKPQPNGKSFAKLKLVDQIGLTLAVVKSEQFSQENWVGVFRLDLGQFHFLQLEGRCAPEENQLLTTNISEY